MIKARQFTSIWLMSTLSFFLGTFVAGSYKAYGIQLGFEEGELTLVGSLGALFNALRFVWSGLLDTFSYKKVYGSLLLL
jgi:hypothetical protein